MLTFLRPLKGQVTKPGLQFTYQKQDAVLDIYVWQKSDSNQEEKQEQNRMHQDWKCSEVMPGEWKH